MSFSRGKKGQESGYVSGEKGWASVQERKVMSHETPPGEKGWADFSGGKKRSGVRLRPRGEKRVYHYLLKVHKNENFFCFDFEICTFS
jgi:hypothetical protein